MPSNSSSGSDRAQQTGQTIRATGDLSPSKRTSAVDNALNGSKTTRK